MKTFFLFLHKESIWHDDNLAEDIKQSDGFRQCLINDSTRGSKFVITECLNRDRESIRIINVNIELSFLAVLSLQSERNAFTHEVADLVRGKALT